MTERFNIHTQLEHLQMKYVGTGHADISRYEWVVNHHRDSAASYIGHSHMSSFFAVVENESIGKKESPQVLLLMPCTHRFSKFESASGCDDSAC